MKKNEKNIQYNVTSKSFFAYNDPKLSFKDSKKLYSFEKCSIFVAIFKISLFIKELYVR